MEVAPDYPMAPTAMRLGDSGAIWTPSPNYNSRSGADAEFVVIHTCEGGYSGCWGWLTNSSAGVSAHYVVNDDGTQVRQLVDEDSRAWHISAKYACSRNDGVDCEHDGRSMNTIGIGIEHAGYGGQSSWDPGLIQRSAELTCGITERHDIPRDSYHIVGHGQLQPWNRSDPGANWPWSDYLSRVQEACDDSGSTTEPEPEEDTGDGGSTSTAPIVIDSNNGANETSRYYVDVSSSWWASANVSGYWNTGYWVAPTAATSDPASFWFKADSTQCYRVEGWWSAGSDRPAGATFLGWNASDSEVGRVVVDQRKDGGRWNHLGDWTYGPGWNRVVLSRWAASGSYVVADAVRVTPGGCGS
jgi:N-acetyl-anhydromuramyl-L-alanine amidase AmpD